MNHLCTLISLLRNGAVYIRTHNFPDPDAIASAYGLQYLLRQNGIESTICFTGRIDRYNTKKMIDLLHISFIAYENLPPLTSDDHMIYIDAQHANANVQQDDVPCHIYCIDHHPIYKKSEYAFSDIRPDYGACCTIIGQYFMENGISFTTEMATALIYGLKIDTANLSRGVSDADLDVFYRLYSSCDLNLIQSIENNTLLIEDLDAYRNSIQTLDIQGDYCFADTGSDCQEALIATICDFLIALVTIDLAIVYSVKEEGIKISVRSSNGKYNAGEICNAALRGIGNGGGHCNMAGGFVPRKPDSPSNAEIIDLLKEKFALALSILSVR